MFEALSAEGGAAMALLGSAAAASLGRVSFNDLPSNHIALRFPGHTNKFCYVEGGGLVKCVSEKIGAHEMLTVERGADDYTLHLKSDHTKKYCGDDGNNGVKCDQVTPRGNARWALDPIADGLYSMTSVNSGKYCMEENEDVMKCISDNKVGRCRLTLL